GVDVDGIVGAGLHASLAADARFGIELDDAVRALVHCAHGTDANAGRVFTVIAAGHLKRPPHVGVGSALDVLHPGSVHAEWDFVLALAGGGAGVAPDALAVVDDESVIHAGTCRVALLV